ncbi:MAG: M20/M25/M40 family metallo-hydrolase [Bacteroidales bacterium]|nr:M20/M25/M40 family metallo-hydrolase [Bacteroidales bacterium]
MKPILIICISLITVCSACMSGNKAQTDQQVIEEIFTEALSSHQSYDQLSYLTSNFPQRLACYPQGIQAAKWTKQIMEEMNLDQVFLQEIDVMSWRRGEMEVGEIRSRNKQTPVKVCALGRGIGTGKNGLEARVIEVNGLDGLRALSKSQVQGKIVFFNQAMDPKLENPFQAYGEAAGQRFAGPILAAEYGAVGAIIRSLTTANDTFPHTGTTRKAPAEETVPSVAIATQHANLLSEQLKIDPELTFFFETTCKNLPDTISYNAIGEITGTDYPNRFIVVGGHLDSWDNSPGAHDDGGGCMQAIEVLRIFKAIGYQPRHSIRAVMFMDEEISQGGGRMYAREAERKGEKHIFAIESDRGVTQPLGFSLDTREEIVEVIRSWKHLFEPYDINVFLKGGGGVDIGPLKNQGTSLAGLLTDPTHYFDWHHSANDTFDQVNREEMQKGAAAMAALIYLIDQHGLEE